MRRAIPSPPSSNREEEVRLICNKCLLDLRREHEVSVALLDGRECGKDSPSYTKVNGTHMRTFFGSGKRKRNAAKVCGSHGEKYALGETL